MHSERAGKLSCEVSGECVISQQVNCQFRRLIYLGAGRWSAERNASAQRVDHVRYPRPLNRGIQVRGGNRPLGGGRRGDASGTPLTKVGVREGGTVTALSR